MDGVITHPSTDKNLRKMQAKKDGVTTHPIADNMPKRTA